VCDGAVLARLSVAGPNKKASISVLVANSRPWPEIIDEMAKREVRCANRHRIKSINRDRGLDV
jgi:hypothetical protein